MEVQKTLTSSLLVLLPILYGIEVLKRSDRPKAYIGQVRIYRIIEHSSQKYDEYTLYTFVCWFKKVLCDENKGKLLTKYKIL